MKIRRQAGVALALALVAGSAAGAQSTPPADPSAPTSQNRDLTFKSDTKTQPPATTVNIPRS